MPLPNAPHVSLREAVLWIAYGDAKPGVDLSGDGLWFNQEKEVVDARAALWFALENGSLEASALGPDGTPATIAKHEWRFLFGRCVPKYSFERGSFERRQGDDGLYVKGKFPHWLSMSGVDGPPRFTSVAIPRDSLLSIWPPRIQAATAAPGRPSIMRQLEDELDRWIAGDFPLLSTQMKRHGQGGEKTLIAVARALEDWSIKYGLKASADHEPRAKGIENALRSKLRKAIELL